MTRASKPTKHVGMSEDKLLRNIIDACRKLGLHTAHFRPGLTQSGQWRTAVQGDGKGWPDLTIVGPGGILFRELKSERGTTTPEQKLWITWLLDAGADVAVWEPRDWWSGRIPVELAAIRRPTRVTRSRHMSDGAAARKLPYISAQGHTVTVHGGVTYIDGRPYKPADAVDFANVIASFAD